VKIFVALEPLGLKPLVLLMRKSRAGFVSYLGHQDGARDGFDQLLALGRVLQLLQDFWVCDRRAFDR